MSRLSRRNFVIGGGSVPLLAACGNGLNSGGAARIDARVDAALDFMVQEVPGTAELRRDAAGMLVMPLVTEAGFGFGGAYGRGALRVGGATVDYYSAIAGSFGLQIGAQQYAHTLFFMTEEALRNFRNSPGWSAGADVRYAVNSTGATLGVDTTVLLDPVIAVIYGQAGLIVGATLEGTRYTRILP
jgi:lipid-binding SYLF domain-containing protein